MPRLNRFAFVLLLGLAACATAPPPPAVEQPTFTQTGIASWYGPRHQGHRTADGERFDMRKMTAAHRSIAFGTVVRVTSLATGRMIKVRVNDRGPYVRGRIIDLSAAAGQALGIDEDGVAPVRLDVFASDQDVAKK